jgi:uncharacterized protein (DUF849 family)
VSLDDPVIITCAITDAIRAEVGDGAIVNYSTGAVGVPVVAMNERGIRPEHECFDLGHVGSLAPLVDMGRLAPPLHVSDVGRRPATVHEARARLGLPAAPRVAAREALPA